jgi:3-mercaptopyruvate sulfurtransferase SseA
VALLLKRRGIAKVRPLAGGFSAWERLSLPLQSLPVSRLAGGTLQSG